jgi:putative transposase
MNIQKLRYKYRLKPSEAQAALLSYFTSYDRGLWNLLLSENMRRYDYDKTFIFKDDMQKLLVELKKFE